MSPDLLKKRSGQRGFTLMEMTMMIAIGAVLLSGLSRAVQNEVYQTNELRYKLIATHLANRQMAIMWNTAYPSVGTSSSAQIDATDFPSFMYTQGVADVATNGGNSLRSIEIIVTLNGKEYARLESYWSNVVTFGNGV